MFVAPNGLRYLLVMVDLAWEREKLEARKMLENGAESPASGARFVGQTSLYKTLYWIQIALST